MSDSISLLTLMSIGSQLAQSAASPETAEYTRRFAGLLLASPSFFLTGAGLGVMATALAVLLQMWADDRTLLEGGRWQRISLITHIGLTAWFVLMSFVCLLFGGDKIRAAFAALGALFPPS